MRNLFLLIGILLSAQAFGLGVGSGGSFQGGHGASVYRLGDPGQPILGLRNDGGSTVTGPDLTYGPLSIDSQGRLNVNSTPAAGGATSANQLVEINDLGLVITSTNATASGTTTINSTLGLINGAAVATATGTTTINTTLGFTNNQLGLILGADNAAATGSTTLNTTLTTVKNSIITLVANSPTLGQKTGAGSIPVVFPSDIGVLATSQTGRAVAFSNRIPYATSNVLTTGYQLVVGSTPFATGMCDIFDSSGQTLLLATDAGSTVAGQIRIVPGGNGLIPIKIVAGVAVSIKAVSGSAAAGEFDINCYQ